MDNKKMEIFAENLKLYMAKANVTQTQLGIDLDIPKTTVSNWVTAKTYPRIEVLEQISEYLGCSMHDLLDPPQTDSQIEAGRTLSSIYHDKKLMAAIAVILTMSEEEKEKVYSFIDFVKATNER